MIINGVNISPVGFDPTPEELANYVEYVELRVNEPIVKIFVEMCPDGCVDVHYTGRGQKFERIRRITGYLSGDISSWNDSKRAEERDRVKHDTRI